MEQNAQSFESVRDRLEEIVDEVNAEGISLDEALKLYEEAVKLGLSACELSESDLLPEEAQPEEAAEGEDAQATTTDAAFEASDIAEAALIEQVGDAASVQASAPAAPAIAGEVEDDGPTPHSR